MFHVELYNPTLSHSYYVIEENGVKRIQIHHQESKRQLAGFNEQLTVQQLFDEIRPMVEKLISAIDDSTRWHIRIFDLDSTEAYSLTRTQARIIAEYVTGDASFINDVKQPVMFHTLKD